ncbi:MAG: hypothetical protein LBL70_07570 [Treponema sp.]|jgi:hypothetical protein|nr:hypothetical protein [Treponema sp.]
MGIYRVLGCFFLLTAVIFRLPAQNSVGNPSREPGTVSAPESLIGLTLEGLYALFGPPGEAYCVRGAEEWQDDVVLVYPQGDFYVYRDRVWQLGLGAARGIRVGDPRAAVLLALGQDAEEHGDYLLLPLRGGSWPMTLRVNLGESGRAAAIFLYRSDF